MAKVKSTNSHVWDLVLVTQKLSPSYRVALDQKRSSVNMNIQIVSIFLEGTGKPRIVLEETCWVASSFENIFRKEKKNLNSYSNTYNAGGYQPIERCGG